MLDLATLKSTLQPIRAIGEVEERFMIQDIEVCMRVLSPKDELAVQRWAQAPMLAIPEEQREDDNSFAVEYLNRFKLGCLARSIVEVNGLDLRNEEYVATGETLANGQPVKISRYDAILSVISEWPRPLLTSVFRKFNEIMERCELQSDRAVEYDPPDVESEIQNLLQRLETLEAMRKTDQAATGRESTSFANEQQASSEPVQQPEPVQQTVTPNPATPNPSVVSPPTSTTTSETRQSAIPVSAAPLDKTDALSELGMGGQELFEGVEVKPAPDKKVTQDGWIDSSDADSVAEAVAAETARMQQIRANRNKPKVETGSDQELGSANPRFVPPTKR